MPHTKRGRAKKIIFDSIRKPVAPPSRKIGDNQSEERARPALRKIKHKKKVDPKEIDADF